MLTRRSAMEPRLVATLLVLATVAWIVTARVMNGISMSRYDLGSPAAFLGLWVLMMAAMMFPSMWPAVLIHGRVLHRRGGAEPGRGAAFVAGYLVSWAAYGVVAFAVVAAVRHSLAGVSDPDLARYVVAPIAVLGAAYQATPLKRVCLRTCRSPLFWLAEHWREGRRGSLRMGVDHGAFCVGCCWVLMALVVAAGTMSVTWMAAIAVVIAVEKLLPVPPAVAATVVAGLFVAVAVVALADPSALPGFGGGGGSMSM